ncbi:hypothetical protein SDC9_187532 [bioreactor metagenome]|uniref:Uncharacterized protein n=1 Tax=bioreactor metagenome TaxID=1076179 RepID=A0A645HM37_9ZZZZ
MGDVAAREGGYRQDGDGAARRELGCLLINLGQVGIKRSGHGVLRGNLIHAVRYNG